MGTRVKDKVVLITGGALGIGAGTAKRFIEEGAFVVISDIDVEAGQRLTDSLGEAARFMSVDVTKEEDVAAAVDFAVREFGRLDCIINNAGIIGAVGPIKDISIEAWDRTLLIVTADHECGGLTVRSDRKDAQGNPDDVTWSSGGHTDTPVPVYTRGVLAERVKDVRDNTDVFGLMKRCLERAAAAQPAADTPRPPLRKEAVPTSSLRVLRPAA